MGLESKAGFVGLVTATSEVTAGGGALRIADNVTLRKEGALVLRSHFGSTALPRAYAAAFPYKGALFYVNAATGAWTTPSHGVFTYPPSIAAVSSLGLRADIQAAKEARGNLYLATAGGALKVHAAGETTLANAGIYPTETGFGGLTLLATGSNDLLTTGQQVAYRVVTTRTDTSGVVARSRPSGAVTIAATGTQSPQLLLYYSPYPATTVARTIEIYRTRTFPAGVQVDDEMQLVTTLTLPPSVGTSVTYTDKVPDTARGTTLYTSPSRGGIESANDRPPGAACVERFRTSLFFGNTVGPHRVVMSYSPGGVVTGSATRIGMRVATGTVVAGSNQITSVSNTTGLQVGMFVVTQTNGNAGVITNIAGSTVTVSVSITSGQTANNVYFTDAFTISDGAYGGAVQFGIGTAGVGNYIVTSGAVANAGIVSNYYTSYEVTPPAAGYAQTVVVERIGRGGSPFTVKATHGDEVSPPIPLASSGGAGLASTNDVFPHGLAWSEPDEPEHVPPKNFARVGDAGKAILALIATKDRLLIFKEDGLYMLVGNTAKDFGIYPLDTTALCILPGSVKRLQNTVYALTNLGLIAVDEGGGVNIVSRPIQNELAPIITQIRQTARTNGGLYYMPGLAGVTGTADDPNGEYWMMLGTTSPSFGGQMLVYNAFRQGFTTYSFGTPTPGAVAQDGEGQPLVLTASTLLTPSTSLGAITARISPRAFSDPALVGKLWTHVVAGFSRLTGTTSITARFSSSESMVDGTTIDEVLEAPTSAGLVQLPAGSLMRHPVPRAMARAFLSFVELVVAVSNGTFTLELMGMEARENIPNKRPTHGTGST